MYTIDVTRPTCAKAWARLWMPSAGLSGASGDLPSWESLGLLQLLRGLRKLARRLNSRSFSWLPGEEAGQAGAPSAAAVTATPGGFSTDVG